MNYYDCDLYKRLYSVRIFDMTDYLLRTWETIHRELFYGIDGKPSISLSTLQNKYGPGLKASGVVFSWRSGGPWKRPVMAGWKSKIMSHFTKLAQLEDAERVKKKADKRQQSLHK